MSVPSPGGECVCPVLCALLCSAFAVSASENACGVFDCVFPKSIGEMRCADVTSGKGENELSVAGVRGVPRCALLLNAGDFSAFSLSAEMLSFVCSADDNCGVSLLFV